MTIQRQYSLPNCTLVLEGLSNAVPSDVAYLGRPILDILIRFECHLLGQAKPLVGGRELLESLASSANQCVQQWMSGVHRSHSPLSQGLSTSVKFQQTDSSSFRLVVPQDLLVEVALLKTETTSSTNGDASEPAAPIEMDLSMVQMFDLVEAFDQLFADRQTLPELSLQFHPLSRREAVAGQPIVERAAPVALGTTSLALATAACFLMPVPQVRKPQEPPTPKATTPSNNSDRSPTLPTPVPGSPKSPQSSSSSAILASAPMITKPQQLAALRQQLYLQISQTWKNKPTFYQDLIYRVGVNQQGQVVGYRFVNQAAIDYAQEVPLLNLLEISVEGSNMKESQPLPQEPLAQFQVVFKSDGSLQVKTWAS